LFLVGVTWSIGMPSMPWAIGLWVASESVMVVVSSWVMTRATGYSVLVQFGGVLNPLLASLLMAAATIGTRSHLPAELGPLLRLVVLLPLGALVFAFAIFFLDRPLVKDFLAFARSAFDSKWNRPGIP